MKQIFKGINEVEERNVKPISLLKKRFGNKKAKVEWQHYNGQNFKGEHH